MRTYVLVAICLLHILQTEGQPLEEDKARIPGKILSGGANGTCPSQQDKIDAKDELRFAIPTSLAAIVSGCGGAGWRRVGYLDMTDPSQSCPPGLSLKSYSAILRSCGRVDVSNAGCWSTFYSNNGFQYSRVCGRVRGYQFGFTHAFESPIYNALGLDGHYVDGVSLTHGPSGNRTHIWTFAVGLTEAIEHNRANLLCPCVYAGAISPPVFVGSDYFCESGLNSGFGGAIIFYPDDPLWDGQNCISNCCRFNNPPYFTKTLPAPTSDDIELRICSRALGRDAGSPIDQVELYVQ